MMMRLPRGGRAGRGPADQDVDGAPPSSYQVMQGLDRRRCVAGWPGRGQDRDQGRPPGPPVELRVTRPRRAGTYILHVQICHKGAPGRDQWRAEARNINVSSRVFRLDPGLCGRFGQLAPPRALWGGRLPASARSMTSTPARTPARRAVADRASTPFDRAGPARAPPRTPRRRPDPRDRHLTHENVPLADDLAGYPAISAVKWRSRGLPGDLADRHAAPPPPRTTAR